MARPYTRHSDVRFTMAPMIDVVFLLIIFFMLVSTFASAENIRMDLPNPEHSLAEKAKITDRVVINCIPASMSDGGEVTASACSIGPNPPESLDRIGLRIASAKSANPELKVIIRADKRLRYDQVREVMQMVAEQRIEDLKLVAHVAPVP